MKPSTTGTALTGGALAGVVLCLLISALFTSEPALAQESPGIRGISPAQQERLALMKSRGPELSLTIFPVVVVGTPYERVSEIVGLLLEQQGLKNMEIGKTAFEPGAVAQMAPLAGSVGQFVKKSPIATGYALYAEYTGNRQTGIDGIRTIVVDSAGAVVWTDSLGPNDQAVKNVSDRDPMGFSLLLVERLRAPFGLNEETARAATPGKFARLMEERSGLPPENERAALPQRQKELRNQRKTITLMIFPARVTDAADPATATQLVKMITDAGLCKAAPAPQALLLKASRGDPNELKVLWDLAREFREYVRSNPPAADYVLYADYGFIPQTSQVGFVHFTICDRKGEWVVVDLQNSLQPDFQTVNPTSIMGCNVLLVKRLGSYLKLSTSDLVREKIETSGIEAAAVAFHEAKAKPDEYYLSEQGINELGYEYLQTKRYKEAIAVFKLNVEAFPGSFNVYDSLGEAYTAAGEKDLAIKNYKRSLELNPNSQSGIEALRKLEAK
jgi:hypothetical protein